MVKTTLMLSDKCVRAVLGCKVGVEEMSTLSVRSPGYQGTVLDTRALRVRGVTTIESVKRNLFGCTTADREENRRFVEKELARQIELDNQRWGFDFVNERPLPGNHRFVWSMVPPSSVPAVLRSSVTITPKVTAPKVQKETKISSPEGKTQKRITDFLKPRKRLTNSGKKSAHKHECHGAIIRPPKVARLA